MKASLLLVFSILLVSACVSQQEIKEITIPGHGNQVYTFANDIRLASKVFSNDEQAIRNVFLANNRIMIVHDGSNQQDNAFFAVITVDLDEKIPTYFAYEGKIFSFGVFYFIGDRWYNQNKQEIEKPELKNVLWFKGPNTGANETSVMIDTENNIIYLQGETLKNLRLAADKLALIVFDYKP